MAQLQGIIINDTSNLTLPAGTTNQRPTNNITSQSFTSVGTTAWTAPAGVTSIEVLVVAGGGGGGRSGSGGSDPAGGGGGAGGVIYNSNYSVIPGTSYTVTVGSGGGGAQSAATGSLGSNSVFDTLIALGGGGGGGPNQNGANGGSGGGGGGNTGTRGFATLGQGNNGGDSTSDNGGGGGGAGRIGFTGTGGQGLAFSISGAVVGYAGGGGGGQRNGAGAAGGLINNVLLDSAGVSIYGGGRGGNGATPGEAGLANRGGGGGGSSVAAGGTGGSGIVIIRYSAISGSSKTTKGQVRFNTTTKFFEYYRNSSKWQDIGGLVIHLDAGNSASYSGSGSTWNDISGFNNHCVFTNTPTYVATSPSYFTFSSSVPHFGTIRNNNTLNFTYGQTLIMVMRHTYASGRRNPWDQAYGGWGTWTHEQGNNINNYIGTAGEDNQPYIGINSGDTPRSVWNMLVTSRGPLLHTWYRNNVITNITQHEYGNLSYTYRDIRVGQGYAGSWDGDMSLVLVYNRELSQAEVTKIYQNISTRYGI